MTHRAQRARNRKKSYASRGFSLIELLAVTAIIVILTSVVLVSNSRFGGAVLLESLAYDIALTVRQAQVYGIATRQSSGTYNAGYGLHFDMSDPLTYRFFADTDPPSPGGDGLYTEGKDTIVQTVTIEHGFKVQSLCVTPPGSSEDCSARTLDVLFKRPEPDAWISENGVSCVLNNSNCKTSARICITSPRGDVSSILIDVNGQVSVQKQCP